MKHLLPLLTLFCMTVFSLQAQSTNETNTPPDNPPQMQPSPPPKSPREGPMANLTDAERAQLKTAHDKAIEQDPALEQKMKAAHEAMDEARKAMHDAMLKIDPSLEPILAKITPRKLDKAEGRKWRHDAPPSASTNSASASGFRADGRGFPPGFASLTPSEQAQLKSLHEQVENDPSVVAAKEVEKSASTSEALHAARERVHRAMHDAMIKADPSIEPILQKLHPSPPQSGGASGGASSNEGQAAPMMTPQ